MRSLMLATVTVLAATPAASIDRPAEAKRLEAMLAGRTPGEPRQCLDRIGQSGYQTLAGTLVFRYGTDIYINRTRGGCGVATSRDALVIRAGTSRLCSGDVARVVDPRSGVESGVCTLDSFVPYRK